MLYSSLLLYYEQEKNYVTRTDKQPIDYVVRQYYAKYVIQEHENSIVNAIRYCVRYYQQHNGVILTDCARKAVQIIYENKDLDFLMTATKLDVSML